VLSHRGLFNIGSWTLEYLLYTLGKVKEEVQTVISRAEATKYFFEEVYKYCNYSIEELWTSINNLSNGR